MHRDFSCSEGKKREEEVGELSVDDKGAGIKQGAKHYMRAMMIVFGDNAQQRWSLCT